MSTNGNPLGSRKVLSAQQRIARETSFLSDLRVLTPANSELPDHVKIATGEIKSLPSVLAIAEKVPGVLFVNSKAVEISLDLIRNSLAVIRDCKRVLSRFNAS